MTHSEPQNSCNSSSLTAKRYTVSFGYHYKSSLPSVTDEKGSAFRGMLLFLNYTIIENVAKKIIDKQKKLS